ncbi:recombinase RecT [Engelhardtia mirabilis]|uniref:Recombination and repair protein RecT n=1 Tax=Engelhardtia mirabilis TaxID=2528011 RepID=A0A518BL22_9BACT|nr:recombination and repair protein RecT [Planctomycetes bacterium Pla133]QDV01993.1 recombination and repair protein RecT [Planctomycetes bacterium Pla86]
MTNQGLIKSNDSRIVQLRGNLDRMGDQIERVLPAIISPERFVATIVAYAQRMPALFECEPLSLYASVMEGAVAGLSLDGFTGEGYLIPRYDKRIGGKACTFLPGYKGLVKLMIQGGGVDTAVGRPVFEKDHFEFRYTAERDELVHVPTREGEAGLLIGAYAIGRKRGQDPVVRVCWRPEIDAARGNGAQNSFGWQDHFAAMASKTPLRRMANMVPLSPVAAVIARREDAMDGGAHLPLVDRTVIDQSVAASLERVAGRDIPEEESASTRADELANRLGGSEREPGCDDEPPLDPEDVALFSGAGRGGDPEGA